MDQICLVINPGSTSKKYALYKAGQLVAKAHFESVGHDRYQLTFEAKKKHELKVTNKVYKTATSWLINMLMEHHHIKKVEEIDVVALRVVAPGSQFNMHQAITVDYIEALESRQAQAPLHITPLLNEIRLIGTKFPQLKMVAVSDSAFHKDLPDVARYYGIPYDDAQKWEIHRFGYHGISVNSIVRQLSSACEDFPSRLIVCHLGGGASITAIKDGQSVDTSMGLTPLEGLLMNSRGGDLDDGALLHLAKMSGMNYSALEEYINTKSGLLGVSGQTGDVRRLLDLEAAGHAQAHLALEMFIYRVKKYIGSYTAVLNGLDVLVFSATIGERSAIMRQRMCNDMEGLGIHLDDTKNFREESGLRWINQENTQVGIAVVPTDELGEMAHLAVEVLSAA